MGHDFMDMVISSNGPSFRDVARWNKSDWKRISGDSYFSIVGFGSTKRDDLWLKILSSWPAIKAKIQIHELREFDKRWIFDRPGKILSCEQQVVLTGDLFSRERQNAESVLNDEQLEILQARY